MMSKKRWNNDGVLFPDPGKFIKAYCGICGSEMGVKRTLFGPTSFAASIGKRGRYHDFFTCPHYRKKWHEHAVALKHEKSITRSVTMRRALNAEMQETVKTKKVKR